MNETQIIEFICEQIGYGRVMQIASELWQKKDPTGALTIGPCTGLKKSDAFMFDRTDLENIRARTGISDVSVNDVNWLIGIIDQLTNGVEELSPKFDEIKRTLTKIRRLSLVMNRFEKEFQDDSDSVNNSSTNGYFPPRPSDEAIEKYRYWEIELSNAHSTLTSLAVQLLRDYPFAPKETKPREP